MAQKVTASFGLSFSTCKRKETILWLVKRFATEMKRVTCAQCYYNDTTETSVEWGGGGWQDAHQRSVRVRVSACACACVCERDF